MIAEYTVNEISRYYHIKYHHITLSNGTGTRSPFLQHFINFESGAESFYVADGNYNKKQYKNFKNAYKAFESVVGACFLDGYTTIDEDASERFKKTLD